MPELLQELKISHEMRNSLNIIYYIYGMEKAVNGILQDVKYRMS